MTTNSSLLKIGSNINSITAWNTDNITYSYIYNNNVRIYPNEIRIYDSSISPSFFKILIDDLYLNNALLTTNSLFFPGKGRRLQTTSSGLSINGNLQATSIIHNTSDIRLKNIKTYIENPIELIQTISAFKYCPSTIAKNLYSVEDTIQIGVSAQDVQKIFPELVCKNTDNYLALSYSRIIPILIECIKELNSDLEMISSNL